ncbi:MAG: pyridoxamine 5'-phosphate oxidase family protein [Devosia sp.]
MTDHTAHARDVIAGTSYMVLATAGTDGDPWATPVWFAADGLDRLYWLSWPGARHSQLISERPRVAITVFDSTVAPNAGAAFYATGSARQCEPEELPHGLEIVNARGSAQGLPTFTAEQLSGSARLRLYVVEIAEAWVLDQDASVDQRAVVQR